jgi:hypothetical protein
MTTLTVTACRDASVQQDGSLIELNLEGQGSERVTLQFDEEILDQLIGRSLQLIAEARNKKHAKTGVSGIAAMPVAAAGAGPNANGSHVILVLKTHTGGEFQFAIPTQGAEQFAKHIMTSVAAARQQSTPPQ